MKPQHMNHLHQWKQQLLDIDFVSDGLNSAKAVFIITKDGKKISSEILKRLGKL